MIRSTLAALMIALPALFASPPAFADPAAVVKVSAKPDGDTWTFSVTLRHADKGWDDYADGWRVESAGGKVLGDRPLAHPHENEQPFTRAQSGIRIPEGTTQVLIRARTTVEGWAKGTTPFNLPR
ncbi:hypothetical protein [Oceaniovalibus sp. ACAM 378]|uniref:hypothetical protein n=1 Tax=Oceaniovalibus sp. ACAM 378 TaxID=2599923 RepID=UPI002102F2DA|nr:hypothetical protein [Oceaniovalibus sp. ACAM 378]